MSDYYIKIQESLEVLNPNVQATPEERMAAYMIIRECVLKIINGY